MIERVLNECRRGLFWIVVIAHSQRCASDTQLAFFVCLGNVLVVLVKDQNTRIAKRFAYRNRFVVGNLTLDSVINAIQCDFNGTIEVGKSGLRKVVPPAIELLGRKDLSSEPAES